MTKKIIEESKLKEEYTLLCLDPSLKCTGMAVLKISNKKPFNLNDKNIELIDYTTIPTHNLEHGQALMYIEKVILNFVDKYKPDYVAAESPFVGRNNDTIQKLAHIHGIIQLIMAKHRLDVIYYSVMSAKSQVLNGIKIKKEDGSRKTGDEMKIEVANAIYNILGKQSFKKEHTLDITDAISMGITFIKLNGKPVGKKSKKRKTKKKQEK